LLRHVLGDAQAAQLLGEGRVNFLDGCQKRLVAAAGAVAAAEGASGSDFASGYGAFLDVVPLQQVSSSDPIGDLVDPAVRARILDAYRTARQKNAIAQPLPDDPERIATAIVIESIDASEKQRETLEDELIALCSFTQSNLAEIERCKDRTLRWLGRSETYVESRHARARSVTGSETDAFEQWFYVAWVLAGFLGVGSCGAAWVGVSAARCSDQLHGVVAHSLWSYFPGLISCGPGWLAVAGVIGGWLGAIGGVVVNGWLAKRTAPRTAWRLIGRVTAMAVAILPPGLWLVAAWSAQG
jgi:hypothetical protein